jgi:hypothetical protein
MQDFDQARLLTEARQAADIQPQTGRIQALRRTGQQSSVLNFVSEPRPAYVSCLLLKSAGRVGRQGV